jgi:hypothetical protein
MEKRDVAIEDYKGLWSIYEESGQVLEIDFTSKEQAVEYAKDMGWNVVDRFNIL